MKALSPEEVDKAGKAAQEIFHKYNISEEDQDKLYNALATIGLWKMVQDRRKQ